MRIVHVVARLNAGGVARQVSWLVDALQQSGHEVVLLSGCVRDGETDGTYLAVERAILLQQIATLGRRLDPWADVKALVGLYRALVRFQPDVIHTHGSKAGVLGRLAGLAYRGLGSKRCILVHTFHGHVFHAYFNPLYSAVAVAVERLLARFTDAIIVLAPSQRQDICNQHGVGSPHRFAIIPVALTLHPPRPARGQDTRRAARAELGLTDGDVALGIVGRLTAIKNHELFLQAAASCVRSGAAPNLKFLVIGDGELRAHLEGLAVALGLGAHVRFAGHRSDIDAQYQAIDAVVLASHSEGSPLALVEAMAHQRAVLSTCVGGVRDLLGVAVSADEDGYTVCERGIAVPSGDVAAMAAGMRRLADDLPLRTSLGERGWRYVRHEHAAQNTLDQTVRVYTCEGMAAHEARGSTARGGARHD